MKNIDRLFNDTLADHASSPSPALWERVEATLPQGRGSAMWVRWAAVLVPALVAAGIWMSTRPQATESIASQTVAPALQPVESIKPVLVAENTASRKTTTRKKPATKPQVVSVPNTETIPAAAVEETTVFEDITLEPVVLEEEAVMVETPKPLVLVYTLEPVATKTSEIADRNTLDRVVDFARTVKHSDPIGDIRGLKDELFALDLRKKQPKKN